MSVRSRAIDLVRTTKPTITLSNTLMAAAGVAAAWQPGAGRTALAATCGTALAVAAANTFNMALEHRRDALMARTRHRPIAAGRLSVSAAWASGAALTLGAGLLLATTTLPAALVALAAIATYAFIYTPLKAKTPHALFVGALPGATPPLIGALAMGHDHLGVGLSLAALLFLWQVPHFLAIATRREGDYRRAGLRPFPVTDGEALTRSLARWTALGLLPASLLPWASGAMSTPAAVLLVSLGAALAACTLRSRWVGPTFLASLAYLPLVTALVLIDRAVTLA